MAQEWWNLLDEEKQSFDNYVQKPQHHLHPNNIHIPHPLTYIRCYIRAIQMRIDHHFEEPLLEEVPHIESLIRIAESYPHLNQFYELQLHYLVG